MIKTIVLATILMFSIVLNSYADKVITLNKIKVENVQLYKQQVNTGTEEAPVMEYQWKMSINYTMKNDTEENQGGTKVFDLTSQQRTKAATFLSSFIDELKTDVNISTVVDE